MIGGRKLEAIRGGTILALSAATCLTGLIAAAPAFGDAPSPQAGSLADAVSAGHTLFTKQSFGGAGTCETCHLDGGHGAGKLPDGSSIPSLEGAAAHYPRYAAKSHEVITLSGQITRCITGALNGHAPAPGSTDAVFLETYVASLSKGAVMGGQFPPSSAP